MLFTILGLGKERSKFGRWLDAKGIKQQWVAEKSGVSRGTISQLAIEDNRRPTYSNAMKIIKALHQIEPSVNASDFWDV